jgi:hypothetical protein
MMGRMKEAHSSNARGDFYVARGVFAMGLLLVMLACRQAPPATSVLNDVDWTGEPVGPIEVMEATGLLDGGTKIGGLRDGRGKEYWFAITPFSFEGERPLPTNRLLLFKSDPWEKEGRWDSRARVAELHSPEENFVRQALELAISTFPKHQADEGSETTKHRSYLKILRKRLDTLGKSENEVDLKVILNNFD